MRKRRVEDDTLSTPMKVDIDFLNNDISIYEQA